MLLALILLRHHAMQTMECYASTQNIVTIPMLLQALPNVGTNDFFARFTYRVGNGLSYGHLPLLHIVE